MAPVKPQKHVGRREKARETRLRIIDAAYRLFCADGYEATTMQLIADAADVAVQTVYFTFGTKAKLLREVEMRAVLGGVPDHEWREQPWAAEMRDETDPGALLRRFVEVDSDIKARLAPLVASLGAAISSDAETTAQRDSGRDAFFASVVDRLAALGALRADVSRSRALDVVRVVNTVEAYTDLTMRRGWTHAEWQTWLLEVFAAQLLSEAVPSADG